MNSINEAKWHWAEGIKFALEGVKLLFVLNGAASISILTFIGNLKINSSQLIWALISFSFGAASTIPTMIFAYLTQLQYGNASLKAKHSFQLWQKAGKKHYAAYLFITLGIMCFLIGTILASYGLMHIQSPSIPCQNHP